MVPEEYTVVDIETYPNEDMIDRLPEPKVDSRLKDPVKIEAALVKSKQKQIDDMALSPLYGKVACVGFTVSNRESACYICENEKDVIEFFFDNLISLENSQSPKLATWDGNRFDLPFLYKRAMVLGIKTPLQLTYWTKRYQVSPHCDVAQAWGGWNSNEYKKLDDVAKAVLGYGKIEFDVTTIKDLIKTKEGREEISTYCKGDVKPTKELLYKMANVLF